VPAPCSDPARPTPNPEATVALGQPLLGHLDPEFLRILDETSERLRHVFGTANRRTLPLPATGSAGMEAAFVNTVGPGAVVGGARRR
jgi:alanine-glyoxylate transaminase/serine-glyoxylate transaminase/serine-pyruvate transaminase